MGNNLGKSILAAISYFDIFDYPLTAAETWKWMFRAGESEPGCSLRTVEEFLEKNEFIKSLVDSGRGFYFLRGRENIVDLRQTRYNLAGNKFKKALRVARFLRRLPGIRMIAVCNSLAWNNASEESDIDFFIVVGPGKIWAARFWSAGFLKLFGLRPSKNGTKDRICLSFFTDEKNMNLEKISLSAPDVYLIYWISQVYPVYDVGGVYSKFIEANSWIKKYLPNFFPGAASTERQLSRCRLNFNFLGAGEKFFRSLQTRAMPREIREIANKDSRVIVGDSMLKFHVNDRRAEYGERWLKKLGELENQL